MLGAASRGQGGDRGETKVGFRGRRSKRPAARLNESRRMDLWVAEANIARLKALLVRESDGPRQAMMRSLLSEHEAALDAAVRARRLLD